MSKIKKALEKAKVARENDPTAPEGKISPQAPSAQAEMRHEGEVKVIQGELKIISMGSYRGRLILFIKRSFIC